jgi:CrcB protein
MTYLWIFLGGGLGSLARYSVGRVSNQLFVSSFPIGTLIANLLACLILAILVVSFQGRSNETTWLQPLLIVGFCGGFSTFSTFSNDTVQLMNAGNHLYAISNILISVAFGIGLIYFIRLKS